MSDNRSDANVDTIRRSGPMALLAILLAGLAFKSGQWLQEADYGQQTIPVLNAEAADLRDKLRTADAELSLARARLEFQAKELQSVSDSVESQSAEADLLHARLKAEEGLRKEYENLQFELEKSKKQSESTKGMLEAATRALALLEAKWLSDGDFLRSDFPDLIGDSTARSAIAVTTLEDPNKSDAEKFAASGLLVADQDPQFVDAIKRIIDGGDASPEMRQFAANSLDRFTEHPDAASVLIQLLDDKDQKTVGLAITSLGAFKSSTAAREALEIVLGDGDRSWNHRGAAGTSLYRIGSEEATEPLIAAAREGLGAIRQDPKDVEVQEAVGAIATALGQLPASESHDVLVELLLEERVRPGTRGAAVTALVYVPGSAGKKEVVDALLECLQSAETDIRGTAVTAVGQLAIPASVNLLIDILLTDEELDIGGAAATALRYVVTRTPGDSPADQLEKIEQALVAAIELRPRDIRGGAVTSLGQLKSTIAVPVLTKLCLDENEATDIRRAAVTSLVVIAGDSPERMAELAATLVDMLTTEKELPARLAATVASTMGYVGNRDALGTLIKVVDRDDESAALGAALAIFVLMDADASEQEVQSLIAKIPEITANQAKDFCVLALGRSRDSSAISALTALLLDDQEDEEIRVSAAMSLGLMETIPSGDIDRMQRLATRTADEVSLKVAQPVVQALATKLDDEDWKSLLDKIPNPFVKAAAAEARFLSTSLGENSIENEFKELLETIQSSRPE